MSELGDKIQNFFSLILDVLDGKYGWFSEAASLIGLVLVVNIFVRFFLKKLHAHYAAHKKYWLDGLVRGLYKPLNYYVWFLTIAYSFDLINRRINGQNFFEDRLMHQMMGVGAVLALGWFLLRWKHHVVEILIHRSEMGEIHMDCGKIDMMGKIGTIIILFVISLVLLETVGGGVSTLIAFGGVSGLAVAFASQEIIANFFGGIMIYITHPFAVGDWIHLPERDLEGHVEEIGWYTTRIRTFNKRPVYIPNSTFSKVVVMTPSRMSHRQLKEIIGIRYEDLPVAKDIINDIDEMLRNHPDIDHHLNSMARLSSFGNYALEITVEAYLTKVDSRGYADLHQELLFRLAEIVDKHNAEMAYPVTHIQIHPELMKQMIPVFNK